MSNPEYLNTLIGEGTLVKGDIETLGQVRIDGDLVGSLKSNTLIIVSQSGRVKGNIQTRDIVIGGVIKGDILATGKVELLSTGILLGKVVAPMLSVEPGAMIDGLCRITPKILESGLMGLFDQSDYYSVRDKLTRPDPRQGTSEAWTQLS